MITTLILSHSSYVEFTDIYYIDVLQGTQLSCMGSGVQVCMCVSVSVSMSVSVGVCVSVSVSVYDCVCM